MGAEVRVGVVEEGADDARLEDLALVLRQELVALIRVRAEAPGEQEASVIISGPTGEQATPVRLTMPDTESEPPPPPPEPGPAPPPDPPPKPEPPHVEPLADSHREPLAEKHVEETAEPAGEKAAFTPPWWLIAVPAFLTAVFGNLLVIAGVLSRGWRPRSHP